MKRKKSPPDTRKRVKQIFCWSSEQQKKDADAIRAKEGKSFSGEIRKLYRYKAEVLNMPFSD
ncbi:hypothetical protein [Blastopirellula marina]|uniref:hypothetical protein n=1 Tax=Blastopirellula marina TaxID=124 RepID=UPI0011B09DB9|nr:hypothetical protein [Blastopirellula marina]